MQCREDDYTLTCSDGPVNYRLLNDNLNPGGRLKDFDPDNSLNVKIIQTDDELFRYLEIPFLRTKIDFKKETLLVGNISIPSLG